MKHLFFFIVFIAANSLIVNSQHIYKDGFLPQHLTKDEKERIHEIYHKLSETAPPFQYARSIAEFEPMSGALIRYPLGIPLSLVALMSEEVEVVTIVANESVRNQALNDYQNHGVNLDNISFLIAPTNSIWTRDYGPWYIFDGNNEFGIVDFQYDRPRPHDNAIPGVFASANNFNYHHMGLIHTGGDFMSTGMGIGASTNAVYSVNSSMTPAEVDSIMQLFLGIEDYHVVPNIHGGLSHIDTWAKFLAPDKIMIREVDPSHQYYDLAEQAVAYFESQTSSYGTPFTVYRVYTPNNEPYTNSLILNDRVYVPTIGNAWDDAAISAYEAAMPGYTVYGVYYSGWWSTDALHCRVREIPDNEMLYIKHMPIVQEQQAHEGYQIDAHIIPMSGEALYPDSVMVYYQVGGGGFSSILMTEGEDNWFSAVIPQQDIGSEIGYYIFAADASGRRENHPYIGPYDPYFFTVTGPLNFAVIEGHVTLNEGKSDVSDVLVSVGSVNTYPDDSGWYELQIAEGTYTLTAELEHYIPYVSDEFSVSDGDTIFYNFEMQHLTPPENLIYAVEANDILLNWTHADIPAKNYYKNNMANGNQEFSYFNIYRSIDQNDYDIIATAFEASYTDSDLINGVYSYFVTAVYGDVHESLPSDTATADIEVSFLGDVENTPTGFTRIYPNPFGRQLTIEFALEYPSMVKIDIYNSLGIKVHTLAENEYTAGNHFISWDGRNQSGRSLPDGLYFIRFISDHHIKNHSIIFDKSMQ